MLNLKVHALSRGYNGLYGGFGSLKYPQAVDDPITQILLNGWDKTEELKMQHKMKKNRLIMVFFIWTKF